MTVRRPRARRAAALALAISLAIGCAGSSSSSDRETLAADDPRPVPRGSSIVAPAPCPEPDDVSGAELAVISGRTLAIADEGLVSIESALEAARSDRDVLWTVCLDDKVTRLRALRAATVETAARPSADDVERAAELAAVRAACEEARTIVTEAAYCVSGTPE